MASEGEDPGTEPAGGGPRPPLRRLAGGAGSVAPPAGVRLIREFKGRTVGDRPPPATALPGRVSTAAMDMPANAGSGTAGGLLPGPGARRRAMRRRWLLGGGALALVVAAALSGWLLWLSGSR